jgi:hypothetical protein
MRVLRSSASLLLAAASVVLLGGVVRADVLLDNTGAVGLTTVAPPSELAFATTTAQALTVTLTDFQAPAAFQSLRIAVTSGDTLVGSANVDPTTHTVAVAVPAAVGNYVLHVIGTPDATQGFGSFGACVAPSTSTVSCIAADSFSGIIETPTPSTNPSSALDTTFTSTTAGTYAITITDDTFPIALQSLSGGIASGSTPITSLGLGTTQVTLAANTSYTLIIGARADVTVQAGLYGVHIVDPAGAPLIDRTEPVGTLAAATGVPNTASALTLTLNDYAYPAALTNLGAAVTFGATSLAKLTAAGTAALSAAPTGTLNVWTYAAAGTQPGVYGVSLASGAASLLSTAQVVNPGNAVSAGSFAFVATLPSAGTYNLSATDLQFPSALQSLTDTIAQNGSVLTPNSSGDFTAAAGVAIVLVNAQAAPGGSGVFSVTVKTSGASPQILLGQTQSIGGVFSTQTVTAAADGNYNVTLADLGFPGVFQSLAAVLSNGGQVLGKANGAGSFPVSLTAGQYLLTLLATPGPSNYGLYSLNVSSVPPTVSFKAGSASVVAGQTVQLTWSTQNATACTAAGSSAWTGTEDVSGTAAVAVASTATLTLTCTGPGGSVTQSVTVTATQASSSGGGEIDPAWLALLAVLFAVRVGLLKGRTVPGST